MGLPPEQAKKAAPKRQHTAYRTALSGSEGLYGTRHTTSVWQGNWFSVGIGPVSKATQ